MLTTTPVPVMAGRLLRSVVVALALVLPPAAGGVAAGQAVVAGATTGRTRDRALHEVVVLCAGAALVLVLAWLVVTVAAGCVQGVIRTAGEPGSRASLPSRAPVSPRSAVAGLACALVVAAAGAGPAAAGTGTDHPLDGPRVAAPTPPVTTDLAGGARPVDGWTPRVATAPHDDGDEGYHGVGHGVGHDGDHVVTTGDSLWSIAASRLDPEASATEVAAEWPRWWRANHDVIGDDPHHLRPGTVLSRPS